nr:uncharacterized protein LOC108009958 isoform X2 [Drosophila suzukii]
MEDRRLRMRAYRKARRKFACVVYMVTIAWMVLALLQWLLVSLISDITLVFINLYWISVIFFALAMVMVTLFIFFEKIRFIIGLNWLITVLILGGVRDYRYIRSGGPNSLARSYNVVFHLRATGLPVRSAGFYNTTRSHVGRCNPVCNGLYFSDRHHLLCHDAHSDRYALFLSGFPDLHQRYRAVVRDVPCPDDQRWTLRRDATQRSPAGLPHPLP